MWYHITKYIIDRIKVEKFREMILRRIKGVVKSTQIAVIDNTEHFTLSSRLTQRKPDLWSEKEQKDKMIAPLEVMISAITFTSPPFR